ncbi:hypothetical protein BXZ70DRAFT_927476 [Cristinia sonorae]|uniref:Uncharacterized protein n=1 Tax=Cristinia sonorae TaxID=1940300 RepID=A0A8K0USC7_9AGAR|nr:hypothetical protein BXZ70DRAFT_927476 [Cristinia sonorae]
MSESTYLRMFPAGCRPPIRRICGRDPCGCCGGPKAPFYSFGWRWTRSTTIELGNMRLSELSAEAPHAPVATLWEREFKNRLNRLQEREVSELKKQMERDNEQHPVTGSPESLSQSDARSLLQMWRCLDVYLDKISYADGQEFLCIGVLVNNSTVSLEAAEDPRFLSCVKEEMKDVVENAIEPEPAWMMIHPWQYPSETT